MQDFTQNEIYIQTVLNDRARALAQSRTDPPTRHVCECSLRAGIASRLAALAMAIDSEVARRRIDRQSPAGA
jgi:hypothetical protein